jgi:uncharacterized protein YodC (DUF2158 family)
MAYHKWVSTSEAEHVQCLTCGGVWQDNNPASTVTDYSSAGGETVSDCVGSTAYSCHHYKGECPEAECNINTECNCLHCN